MKKPGARAQRKTTTSQTPPLEVGDEAPSKKGLLLLLGGVGFIVAMIVWALWPVQKSTRVPLVDSAAVPPKIEPYQMEPQAEAYAGYAGSQTCAVCHATEFEKWKGSHHGLAEREPSAAFDEAAFVPAQTFQHGSQTTTCRRGEAGYEIESLGFNNQVKPWKVERVIGHDPLRQFLVNGVGGRLHAMEACFDPAKREWFDVYGDEDRKPGEWGHWTGRGMVWNQMCASCHNTRVRKNYDATTDSYHTAMVEMTVSCESCHGPSKAHVDWQQQYAQTPKEKRPADPTLPHWTRDQHIENCAGCHARRGEVTGDFKPGDSFWDHYLLTVTDQTDTYYPDGQIRDEDYEFASFLSSRMYHAGVRCMDCHDMHSMKTILPGNQLCMRCHTAGGFPNAPAIIPAAHTFHQPESTGSQCVNCHMPQTVYMQRHWRHDHGFTIPDPLMTKEHGIPNACNRCHKDQNNDWTLAAVEKWYGPRMERRTRQRADTLAKAREGNAAAVPALLALLAGDEIPAWKATASLMLDQWAGQSAVRDALTLQLQHEHPLVRTSAIRSLEGLAADPSSSTRNALRPLLTDPSRSVRVSAAWALRDEVDLESPTGKDLLHMLNLNTDQPSGQMQMGQFYYARRDTVNAIAHMERAVMWDPNSPPFHHDLAMIYSSSGDTAKAIAKLRDCIKLSPNEAQYHYELGLALSETGAIDQTITALREAVRLQPNFARAWYNLGLALNGQKKIPEALEALSRGEAADPADPGIPYARATILAQAGRMMEAAAAVEKTLTIQPNHPEAQQLRLMLQGGRR